MNVGQLALNLLYKFLRILGLRVYFIDPFSFILLQRTACRITYYPLWQKMKLILIIFNNLAKKEKLFKEFRFIVDILVFSAAN